jgi:hypothetical protein
MINSPFDEPSDPAESAEPIIADAVPRELPRLRIHHLMTITAGTAVILTIVRLAVPIEQITQGDRAGALLPLAYVLIYSVGFCCALFAAYWRFQGLPAFRQPGQWLLLIFPVTAIALLGLWAFATLLVPHVPSLSVSLAVLLSLLPNVVLPLLFYGYGAWRIADTPWWRAFFVMLVLGALVQLVLVLDMTVFRTGVNTFIFRGVASIGLVVLIQTLIPAAIGLSLLVAAMVNDARSHPRHWSAWFGAGLFATTRLINVIATAISLASLGQLQ